MTARADELPLTTGDERFARRRPDLPPGDGSERAHVSNLPDAEVLYATSAGDPS